MVKWKFVGDTRLYREVLSYSYYNMMSTISLMARGQGSLLLINYFFGTVVNGAFAVAKTIERNILPFANNFHSAAAPQITQSYSNGNMDRVIYLTIRVGKYCIFMFMLAFFPVWSELDFILALWLGGVPEGASIFCQMILLMVFVVVTDGGIGRVVNASGQVARFRTVYSFLTLSCIPIGFLMLRGGRPAYMLLVVFLVADTIWRIVQLYMIHRILHFPVMRYCREVYYPMVKVCAPVVFCMLLTTLVPFDTPFWHISHLVGILLLTLGSIYYVGMKESEREVVLKQMKKNLGFVNRSW